jgi:hypothetical protein
MTSTQFSAAQPRALADAIHRERVRTGTFPPVVRPPVSRSGEHLEPVERDLLQLYWDRRAGERTACWVGAGLGLAGCFWLGVLIALMR